ncbi:CUB and sushi domain-containing protein 1, partial [Geodia barretti]
DCAYGHDEINCTRVTCRQGYFQCPSDGPLGECHSSYYLCNGNDDCEDGYDELDCTLVVGFSSTSYTVTEGVHFASLTITRLGGNINAEVNNVTFKAIPGTADAGSDFMPVMGYVVIYRGNVNWTVDVPIINDMDVENPETFSVSLMSESSRAVVDSIYSYIIITIADNDYNLSCPVLGGITNGSVTVSGGATIAVYSCDEGFELVGESTRERTNDSTWSGRSPTCRSLCHDASNPANGVVSQSGNSVGDMATYTCNDGYELVRSPVLTCQNDGTWDNSPPVCKPLCPDLSNPAPGVVSQSGKSEGDTATYTCNDGYEVIGAPVLNCQDDGTWDDSPPVVNVVVCTTLGNPSNGMVSLTGTSIGNTATYTCYDGYELVGVQVLNCQSNGMWDNSPPICRPLCPNLGNLANGEVSLSGNSEGDRATYACNEGYELVGTPVINCEDGGTWDDPPPTCTPLCPDASNPANGVVSQSGNSEGDTATFACNDGYELVGAPVLTCQDDGTWDNSPPASCLSLNVVVSFNPTSYTVTEGVDGAAELVLVRSGDLSTTTVVTVTTEAGTATGVFCNNRI